MDRRVLAPVAVLAGVALLANPLWLLPAAGEPRHVYRASPADPAAVHADPAVLVCDGAGPSACALERRAVTDGVAVGSSPGAFDDRPAFVYLAAEDRYYRTSVRWDDGARTATGVAVRYGTVRASVARDGAASFPPPAAAVVGDALDDGVARTTTRVALAADRPDGPVVVETAGSYAAVRRAGVDRPAPFGGRERAVRVALGVAGVALAALGVVSGGRRGPGG